MESMTTFSTAAADRRENARQGDGRFGHQEHAEAGVCLLPHPTSAEDLHVWSAADEAEFAAAEAGRVARTGPGIAGMLRRELDRCQTVPGRRLMMRVKADAAHPLQARSYGAAADPGEMDVLAALGYQGARDFDDATRLNCHHAHEIIEAHLTPTRAAGLVQAGFTRVPNPHSTWITEALRTAPLGDIAAVKQLEGANEQWAAMVGLTDPARGDRARQFIAAGELKPTWIESGHELADLQAVRDALPAPKHGEHNRTAETLELVRKGVTGAQVKAYGVKICDQRIAEELGRLDACGHKPTVIRSLHARAAHRSVDELIAFADGGLTKGADLAAYEGSLEDQEPAKILAAAQKLTPEQAVTWANAKAGHKRLSTEEVDGAVKIIAGGYTDHRQVMEAYRGSFYEPATLTDDSSMGAKPIVVLGGVVASGVTPDQAGSMTRAGIPATMIPEHLGEADYWAAGEPYRAEFRRRQERNASYGYGHYNKAQTPDWPLTEADYRAG
jgi:hypothetical protein